MFGQIVKAIANKGLDFFYPGQSYYPLMAGRPDAAAGNYSAIYVFTMANSDNLNQQLVLEYVVNDAVVSHSQAIRPFRTCKFSHPHWKWIIRQPGNRLDDPLNCFFGQFLELF